MELLLQHLVREVGIGGEEEPGASSATSARDGQNGFKSGDKHSLSPDPVSGFDVLKLLHLQPRHEMQALLFLLVQDGRDLRVIHELQQGQCHESGKPFKSMPTHSSDPKVGDLLDQLVPLFKERLSLLVVLLFHL